MKRIFLAILLVLPFLLSAQTQNKKYPSLFWEITGNGLKKPSYLFGTMHVSSKMVFHLSDSFYNALKNVDVVALELNPQDWQKDMYYMQDAQMDLSSYMQKIKSDYLNINSFKINKYEDDVKYALNSEPTVINSLLYRSYQTSQDYEENTYLDLYIYQTGKKLGKRASGVENFFEAEKLMVDAYKDMANEKKKAQDYDEDMYEIPKKLQDAYRRGDLDALDSLNAKSFGSVAFMEKFLYKRNEIQANSMDTIMKKSSLFVGVGAAHLPGKRGVIELLRKMGYKLRPIKMGNRDAVQKETIDKIRVPVTMQNVTTQDGTVSMRIPGKLYRQNKNLNNWQYADMENGTYYMLTRVNTGALMYGHNEAVVLAKVDSMLYENIPGKIIKRTSIVKNGYKGYDITNRTRRGDIQRYNIFITPFEVLVFKMSGNDEYVSGKEATEFFNSINIKPVTEGWSNYSPASGGFNLAFPQTPNITYNPYGNDRNGEWKYEARDADNNAYTLTKKTLYNFNFLEEDTFDISLVEESFKSTEFIAREVSRNFTKLGRHNVLDMQFKTNDSATLYAKATINGPSYYLLTVLAAKQSDKPSKFLNSFSFKDFTYSSPKKYTDTFYKFTVQTPVVQNTDDMFRKMGEEAAATLLQSNKYSTSYWPEARYAKFQNDTTGEAVYVKMQDYPRYYYIKDSASFWKKEFFLYEDEEAESTSDDDDYDESNLYRRFNNKMTVNNKQEFTVEGYPAASMVLTDTGSTRKILATGILQNNRLITMYTLTDSMANSAFLNSFLTTFKPQPVNNNYSVFINKIDSFFADFNSSDSLTKKRAKDAMTSINYGKEGSSKIMSVIKGLKLSDKDYFNTKADLYNELGYIDDECCVNDIISFLKDEYKATADTSFFQNTIILSLSRLATKESTELFKEFLMADPPIFENDYSYNSLFRPYYDTLVLAKKLFPEILQLASVEEYKTPVISLLTQMVDSGYLKQKDYESYFSKLYFDAKILLKKQQNVDEQAIQDEIKKQEDDDADDYSKDDYNMYANEAQDYAILLVPYYDKNEGVQKFFNKLLQSKDDDVKMNVAIILLQNNKPIPDTLLTSIAANDQYRADLYKRLKKIKKENLFPVKYKTQELIARSVLLEDGGKDKFAAVEFAGKKLVEIKGYKDYVYFFKYKIKAEDEWKIGISGLQPLNENEVNVDGYLVKLTDKKFKADKTEMQQFEEELKQLIFGLHKSAQYFYNTGNFNFNYNYNDYED